MILTPLNFKLTCFVAICNWLLKPGNEERTHLEFESGPRTLMGPGEWTEDLILVRASSGRMDPHQIWA